eukprot:gene1071-29945_t
MVPTCIALPPKFKGRKFEGLGALSGGGGTSRLLYDYEEPYRSDILDALFTPKSGGALQILKVEIGGDTQSTEATEASHMHTRDDENYSRGYEWWLMKEAKARNPNIKLSALSWGAPGWVGDGNFFSQDNIDYHIKWLQGAKTVHSLDMDYMGIWNEHDASYDWIVRFRQAMDAAGFSSVKIVATDEGGWQGANLGVGRSFPQAGPLPASCQVLDESYNKSMWTSEGWNLAYTAMVVWNLIYSWYSLLTYATPDGAAGGMGHGLMTAVEPWSGNYRLDSPLYAMMHTTQYTDPAVCRYLENSAFLGVSPGEHNYSVPENSNGWLDPSNQSTIVAFQCGKLEGTLFKGWMTIVVETSGLVEPLNNTQLQFHNYPGTEYNNGLFNMTWSCEGSLYNQKVISSYGPDKHDIYLNITFEPRCIYTITTLKASAAIKPTHPIPEPWSDTFDNYTDQGTVKYFTDEAGSFAAVNAPPPLQAAAAAGVGPGVMVLEQQVPLHPINGRWGNSEPYTLLGNSQNWTDMTVEVSAMITNASSNATILPGSGLMPAPAPPAGYCLIVDGNGSWDQPFLLASGKLQAVVSPADAAAAAAATPYTGTWHTLKLELVGKQVTGTVDGVVVGTVADTKVTYTHGMVAIGSGWHLAYFSNFTVDAKTKTN